MSAISALWVQATNPDSASLHHRMLAAQAVYGPEKRFSCTAGPVSLGGNLLHLLPEDAHDEQPLWSADRSVCLVADVRLDNRADLERTLGLVHPETLADSAVLLAAWLRWGAACLDHILGAFAFAVWTPALQELFAARDHAGERPLFYHRGKDFFALASMPKGLLALPGMPRTFDETRLADWMVGIRPDWTSSFFRGIQRVPLGHLLRVTPDSFACTQYWHPGKARPIRYKRDEEYAEALLELFDRATEARLRSPGTIGTHLSAGLDSSSVTASAARLLAARGQRLTAFTAVPRKDFDGKALPWQLAHEGPEAAAIATLYPNLDHVLVDSSGYDLLNCMKQWTDAMDEPALNVTNLLWITAIQDLARQRGIAVMLEGASGNATLSWESWGILGSLFRRGRWLKLFRTVNSLRDHGDLSYRAALASSTNGLLPAWFTQAVAPASPLSMLDLTLAHPGLIARHHLLPRMSRYFRQRPPDPAEEQSRLFERFDFGPIHAAAQARCGIDPRDPTADKRVFEFCFSIPQEQYIVGGHSRSLVRRAMQGRLPQQTLTRYKRGRQSADWSLPMTEALPSLHAELARIETSEAARNILDLPRIGGLLDTWPRHGFETKRVDSLWHLALTRALSMGYFLRSHAEHAPVDQAPERVVESVPPPPTEPGSRSGNGDAAQDGTSVSLPSSIT